MKTILLLLFVSAASAQTVTSVPVQKSSQVDMKKSYLVTEDGVMGCPGDSELYVRRTEPKKKDPKDTTPGGDTKSFFYVGGAALLKSTPEAPYLPVCLTVK